MTDKNPAAKFVKETSEGVTITLQKGYLPAGVDTRVTEIEMREPMVKDQMIARKQASDDAEMETVLLCALTGLQPSELESLSARDYARVQAGYNFFMD